MSKKANFSSKKANFLSKKNTDRLIKIMYQIHLRDGGKSSYKFFETQIPELMMHWKELSKLDSYESLEHTSDEEELIYIDSQFIDTYSKMYSTGAEITMLTPTGTMMAEDYGKLDIRNTRNVYVSSKTYRDENKFPKNRNISRNYDFANEGYVGHSITNLEPQRYNMDEIYQSIDTMVAKNNIDYLDVDYYGQSPEDSSSLLTKTNF